MASLVRTEERADSGCCSIVYTAEKGKDDRQLRVTSCRYADRQTDRQMVKLPRQEMDGRQRSGAEAERMQQRQRGFVTVPTTTAAAAAAAAKHLAFGDSRNLRRPPLQGEDRPTDGRTGRHGQANRRGETECANSQTTSRSGTSRLCLPQQHPHLFSLLRAVCVVCRCVRRQPLYKRVNSCTPPIV